MLSPKFKYRSEELNRYMKMVDKFPLLSREEERELCTKIKNCKNAKKKHELQNKLVNHNLRFVIYTAMKFKGYTKSDSVSMSDLVQEGNKGLIRAVEKFDVDTGHTFCTYAVHWVRSLINNYIMSNNSTVSGPKSHIGRLSFPHRQLLREWAIERSPQVRDQLRDQIYEQFRIPRDSIDTEMTKILRYSDVSLSSPVNETYNSFNTYNDTKEDHLFYENDIGAEDFLAEEEELYNRRGLFYKHFNKLPKNQQEVIKARWLAPDGEHHTLREIGEARNLSRERIRQIEAQAFENLRTMIAPEYEASTQE